MKERKGIKIVALFLVTLILTLPFYSANVLAVSVQITKNQGEDGIRGFIDAQGDVWSVEATITGAAEENIPPENVKIRIGQNEAPFNSCSGTALGTACEYISPLTDGVQEGEYPFQVIYNFRNLVGVPDFVSNGELIKADGSGPLISFDHLQQNAQGQIELDFTVNDRVRSQAPAVGIKTMEVVDTDNGNVLQTIVLPTIGVTEYNYRDDGNFNGLLQTSLNGEGQRRLKLRATDWLGHESASDPVRSFQLDTVQPVIEDSLNFTSLGRFIGSVVVSSDITLRVRENNLLEVKAFSDQATLNGDSGDCEEDQEELGLHLCTWEDVEIVPADTIAIRFAARDSKGNTAEKVLSQNFVRDTARPEIEFFGTERIFEGRSYVKKTGTHRIILQVREQGSGMHAEGIRANLLAFGKSSVEAPTECEETETTFNCAWEVQRTFSSSGVARIGLSKFQDNAGNEGDLQEIELFIDDAGPAIEKLAVFGVSDVGAKDYFQSNDRLKIEIKAVETTGLVMLVNLNGVVNDARTLFPANEFTRGLSPADGWQVFTQDSCSREEGRWACEVATEPIKSGPQQGVRLEIRIQDSAGNDAASWPADARNAQRFSSQRNGAGEYVFDLLGLTEEENPDYWEVDDIKPLVDFVDLDAAVLAPGRMPLEIGLKSSNSNVQLIDIKIQSCEIVEAADDAVPVSESGRTEPIAGLAATEGQDISSESMVEDSSAGAVTPVISRTLLYGGVSAEGERSPKPKMIIEFEPFDAREQYREIIRSSRQDTVTVPVRCVMHVFSKVGRDALRFAEIQEVTFDIPFGFSVLGAMDENLQGKIDDIKDIALFKVASVTRYLNEIVKWANWLVNIIRIADSIYVIFTIFNTNLEPLRDTAIASPLAIGACKGANAAQYTIIKGIEWLEIPVAILSCNPQALGKDGTIKWDGLLGKYGGYQQAVLNVYNAWSGRGLIGLPANSLYENILTSVIGACVPGILYNLEKYRQVKCREILCYEKEVPAGIATPDSCAKLGEYLSCRYWKGSLLATALPLIGIWDAILEFLKGWISSPVGLVKAGLQLPCAVICAASNTGSSYCSFAAVTIKLFDILDALAGLYYSRPTLTQDPYCSQID